MKYMKSLISKTVCSIIIKIKYNDFFFHSTTTDQLHYATDKDYITNKNIFIKIYTLR